METVVMGKKIKNVYSVVIEKDGDGNYLGKPYIEKEKETTYEEICRYEGTPQSVHGFICNEIYLSEDESASVTKEKFRADLCTWYQYTNKVLEEKDSNLKKAEKELAAELKLYNTQMIENDDRAKAYCDLHKLDYAETDYEELRKILPGNIEVRNRGYNIYNIPIYNNGIPW